MKRYTLKISPKLWIGGCRNMTVTFDAECKHYRAFLALFFVHSVYKDDKHLVSWLMNIVEEENSGGSLNAPTLNAELTIE